MKRRLLMKSMLAACFAPLVTKTVASAPSLEPVVLTDVGAELVAAKNYGRPVPLVWGTTMQEGTVFWHSDMSPEESRAAMRRWAATQRQLAKA